MLYIAHRINTLTQLHSLDHQFGVELDLRDQGTELILQHDPFKTGELFSDYCKEFKHKFMILNIKSERIEHQVLKVLKDHDINNYFFLDSSFPMTYTLIQEGEQNVALRYSEYEGLDTILNLQGKAKWVWVDCFHKFPISKDVAAKIKEAGFKLCLVSPELQSRPQEMETYTQIIKEQSIEFDAICTKAHNITLWEKYLAA